MGGWIDNQQRIIYNTTMIKEIIALLKISDFYGVSENVDIAKGKYEYNNSFRQTTKQAKRKLYKYGNKESN